MSSISSRRRRRSRSSIAESRNRHVVDRLRRLRRGTGVERRMGIVFDGELNGLGDFGSCDIPGEGEGEIYACGDTGAGHDSPGRDDSLLGWRCSVGGKLVVGAPVGGGRQSV